MKTAHFLLFIVVLGFMLILLSSCETVTVYKKPGLGPPSHAPAHGVRHKPSKSVMIVKAKH